MIKAVTRAGRSTKFVDQVYFEITNAKTYAASVLLKNYYAERDVTYRNSFAYRMRQIGFSRNYLTSVLKETGELCCVYCKKSNLVIELDGMRVSEKNKATIDHIVPTSKGGDPFDYNNLCVACGTCNGEKSDMSVEEYLLYRKHKETILEYKDIIKQYKDFITSLYLCVGIQKKTLVCGKRKKKRKFKQTLVS